MSADDEIPRVYLTIEIERNKGIRYLVVKANVGRRPLGYIRTPLEDAAIAGCPAMLAAGVRALREIDGAAATRRDEIARNQSRRGREPGEDDG